MCCQQLELKHANKELVAQGLYNPRFGRDACGMGFVVDIKGQPSNDMAQKMVSILKSIAHQGAISGELNTGDGAGIIMQMPHRFCRRFVNY